MSHGSRGRIQRRKSRAAALRVEALEERRLLSASRAVSHVAGPQKLDLSHVADVTHLHDGGKPDAAMAAAAKSIHPLVTPLAQTPATSLASAVGHGASSDAPGAAVSSQARQLASLDRPSDGPTPGNGWALGHLISTSTAGQQQHRDDDGISSNSLWTVSTVSSAPTSAASHSLPPLSTTSKSVLDVDGGSHSVTVNVTASPVWQSISASSELASATPFVPTYPSTGKASPGTAWSKPVTPPLNSAPVKAIAGPTPPPTQTSTSKTVVDEEGEKHDVRVKASSAGASWTINTKTKTTPSVPAPFPKPSVTHPPARSNGGTASGPVYRPPSAPAPAGSPVQQGSPPPVSSAIPAAPPVARAAIIAGPAAPPAPAAAPPTDIRSEAAISAQERQADTQTADHPETVAAAETPPDSPTPVDPQAAPPASLAAPPSADGQPVQPLDAEAQVADAEGTDCGDVDAATDLQAAATAMAGLWSSVAAADPGALLAKACDSLVETIPIDAAALDEALSELLDELEGLGSDLATSLAQAGVSPWVAAAALGTAAGAAHRRYRRRQAERSLGTRAAVLAQFPELLGLVPRGDA